MKQSYLGGGLFAEPELVQPEPAKPEPAKPELGHGSMMKRSLLAQIAEGTVQVLHAGQYTTAAGQVVRIRELVEHAVDGTRSYPPDCELPAIAPEEKKTRIEVTNESTLAAARRLLADGLQVAALNFASAKHPGGGFLSGAQAQEESLARVSGLYACINRNPMYEYHKARPDPMYVNYVIWSPDVPVFRDDDGRFLDKPYLCSFITSPAVNAKVVLERDRTARPAIRAAMRERIDKVLSVAVVHQQETLILGAWGCGVFGNDGQEIAELFQQALAGRFHGVFGRIVFAILDSSAEKRFIGPFAKALGGV